MDKTIFEQYVAFAKDREEFRSKPYLCPAGRCTIGYGSNLDVHPEFMSDVEQAPPPGLGSKGLCEYLNMIGYQWDEERADKHMREELESVAQRLERALPWLWDIGDVRACVLIDMAYNMGVGGLLKFKQTLALVQARSFAAASGAMLQSQWATQVKGRARILSAWMYSGSMS